MAEHVDRVNPVRLGVRCNIACKCLEVSAGAVQEDHGLVTGSCLQRARGHTAGVDGRQLEIEPGKFVPDCHQRNFLY